MRIASPHIFPDVRRIAVLNGGGIGDLICVLPAITALAAAYPHAIITLLGTPVHKLILAGRSRAPHHVEVLPIHRGVREGQQEDPQATEKFFERMRAEHFDLAVQVHGGGRFSNPFLLRLGARHTIGNRTPGAAELERWVPYTYYQHEVLRALEVVALAGAAPASLEPRLDAIQAESDAALRNVDPSAAGLLVIHPGASDPRRRWPAERFAEVAMKAASEGAQVIVVGDASDALIAADIVQRAQTICPDAYVGQVSSLAGQLSLSQLIGLFTHADVVLGNDSGPRHLAQAVGAPTIGIYWFGNLINAGPLTRAQHRVHLSWTTHCPVCGLDCTRVGWGAERCEHDVSFVADVAVPAVFADVAEFLRLARGTVEERTEAEQRAEPAEQRAEPAEQRAERVAQRAEQVAQCAEQAELA